MKRICNHNKIHANRADVVGTGVFLQLNVFENVAKSLALFSTNKKFNRFIQIQVFCLCCVCKFFALTAIKQKHARRISNELQVVKIINTSIIKNNNGNKNLRSIKRKIYMFFLYSCWRYTTTLGFSFIYLDVLRPYPRTIPNYNSHVYTCIHVSQKMVYTNATFIWFFLLKETRVKWIQFHERSYEWFIWQKIVFYYYYLQFFK